MYVATQSNTTSLTTVYCISYLLAVVWLAWPALAAVAEGSTEEAAVKKKVTRCALIRETNIDASRALPGYHASLTAAHFGFTSWRILERELPNSPLRVAPNDC